jgi:anthranilate synthase component 1
MDTNYRKSITPQTAVPVVETMPADLLTPVSVFLALSQKSNNCFLLESVEGGETLARYSFVGADPIMVVSGNNKNCTISSLTGKRVEPRPLLDLLREHLSSVNVNDDAELPSFIGGAIGYLNFSCVEWFEPSLSNEERACDEATFMFFQSIVAFDHAKQILKIISLDFDAGKFGEAKRRNADIRTRLENYRYERPGPPVTLNQTKPVSNFEKGDFENAVASAKEFINAGDCYQIVLSQRFSRPTNAKDISIYRALRSVNPSPYMFLLRFADRSLIGASPEMLVRCTGSSLEYRPIAGTRPRGKTSMEDGRLAEEMRHDPKEIAEHVMLVDLGRNDLGRVATFGSVKVEDLMRVEKYSHVQHLVSELSATLDPALDRLDALASCFPAGTVSGAPKVRSIEIIRELEPEDRGIYAGAVGYFDYSGNMDTCIAIRTIVLENGTATIQAGAGIVADSVPELEYQETVNKAMGMIKAVELAESGAF